MASEITAVSCEAPCEQRTATVLPRLIWALPGLLGVALALAAASEFRTPGMTPTELNARLGTPEAPMVVDVRAPVEFRLGHVPGGVNIPHDQIKKRWKAIDTENGVILYCSNSTRTRFVEKILLKKGLPNLYHLKGTFSAWTREQLPVVKDLPQ